MNTDIIEVQAGQLAQPNLEAAFAAFLRLNVAAGDAAEATIRAYTSRIRVFVEWCREIELPPGRAEENHIRSYRKDLIEAGYSRTTIAAYLQAVKRFFDAAVWRGLRSDNPAKGVKAPRLHEEDTRKFLPLAGLRQLLRAPDPDTDIGKRDRAILALAGKHGLRVAEISRLKLEDLHLGDPAWLTVHGKGAKRRQVYLTKSTRQTLEAWLQVRPAGKAQGHVFTALDPHTHGQTIGVRSIRRRVDGYLEEVGLKDEGVSCHSLRHSAATWSLAGGATERSVQDMLGHTKPETTQIYAKIVDRMAQNPATKLEEMLG